MKFQINCDCSIGIKNKNDDDLALWSLKQGIIIRKEKKEQLIENDLFAVAIADGVSACKYGGDAAKFVLDTITNVNLQQPPKNVLFEWTKVSNDAVNKNLNCNSSNTPLGATTLTGIIFNDSNIYGVNIGDTPCYLYRDHELRELSIQHTLAQKKKELKGEIFEQDYHTLLRYVGNKDSDGISMGYYFGVTGKIGDIFLVCSDGLSDFVTEDRLIELLEDTSTSAEVLIQEALKKQSTDNISSILVRIEE